MSTASLDRSPKSVISVTGQGSSRLGLTGPTRVALKVHRSALMGLGALVAATAVAVTVVRLSSASDPDMTLGFADSHFWHSSLADKGGPALLFFPALVAAFVAGPLTSHSLQNGTAQLEWGQSFGPRRWLAARLNITALCAGAACLVLSLLLWFGQQKTWPIEWHARGVFESRGPLLLAYTLFGVAAGALCGLLLRRGYVAVAAAPFIAAALPLAIGSVRWDVWPHETVSGSGQRSGYGSGVPFEALSLGSGHVTESGERLPYGICWAPEEKREAACLAERHVTGWFHDYHPLSHFWQVQAAETLLVLALTAAVTYAAFRSLGVPGKETR